MKPSFPLILFLSGILFLFSCNPQAGSVMSKGKSPALFPVNSGGKTGYINGSGRMSIPFSFESGFPFSETGLARVSETGFFGYIDIQGNYQLEPVYRKGSGDFVNGLARVIANDGPDEWIGKMGFIDVEGNFTIQAVYEDAKDYSEGMAAVKEDGAWGYIDRFGNLTIPFHFEYAGNFSEGLAWVRRLGKYGYINKSGKIVVECQYPKAGEFKHGIAPVLIEYGENDLFWAFIRADGSTAIEDSEIGIGPDQIPLFSEGLLANKDPETKKFGFMTPEGEWAITPEFDDAYPFSEGLAAVKKQDKYGFIDKKGKLIIPFMLTGGGKFSNGLAKIFVDGSDNNYINRRGEFVYRNTN